MYVESTLWTYEVLRDQKHLQTSEDDVEGFVFFIEKASSLYKCEASTSTTSTWSKPT